MKRKIKTITILTVLLLFSFSYNVTLTQAVHSTQESFQPVINADPIIVIDEDSDFLAYPGHGNESHPYIIEGYDIEGKDYFVEPYVEPYEHCITVANTTKHFVIQNNLVAKGHTGIFIDSVAPGTAKIINNVVDNGWQGIWLKNVTGASIENNYISYVNYLIGIYLDQCHTVNIKNNTIENVFFSLYQPYRIFNDIQIESCSGINVTDNEIFECVADCLVIGYSTDILVQNNYIHTLKGFASDGYSSIDLNYVSHSAFINNTLEQEQTNSIYASDCNDLLFHENKISDSSENGINLKESSNSNITWNTITNCQGYGVVLWPSVNNILVHHNTFLSNNLGGTSQAYDSGANNVWFDTTTNVGNMWYDWTGGPYSIDGTAGSVDPYPIPQPGFPEFSVTTGILLLGVSLFSVIVILLKKKKR